MRKIIIFIVMLLLCNIAYAYNISVETMLTESDGSARTGTFEMNYTIINESDDIVFTNISNRTTDLIGKFQNYFNLPYFGNNTLRHKWNASFEDTNYSEIAYVPYAINSLFLQGFGPDYFIADAGISTAGEGAIVFVNASGELTGNASELYWNESSNRLAIGGPSNVLPLIGTDFFLKQTVHCESGTELCPWSGFMYTNTPDFGISLIGARSRGTMAIPTISQDGDDIIAILALAYDGTDYGAAAQILMEVDGSPSNDNTPGRIKLQTTPNGSQVPEDRVIINADGNISFENNTLTNIAFLNNGSDSFTLTELNTTISNCSSDGGCDTIVYTSNASSYYISIANGSWVRSEQYPNESTRVDALYSNISNFLTDTNCSMDDSCTNITYSSNATAYYISIANTSWITDNQFGNCSADGSCTNIVYTSNTSYALDTELIGNCSADNSCTNITYVSNATAYYISIANGSWVRTEQYPNESTRVDALYDNISNFLSEPTNCSADGVCSTVVYTSNATAYYISIANGSWVIEQAGNFSADRSQIAFKNDSNTFTKNIIINGNLTVLGDEFIANVTTGVINGSFLPSITNTFDLGNNTFKWKGVYATNLYGAIDGSNITTGTVADARIASTIARDTELIGNCSADDSCTNITYVSNATAYYISIANASWANANAVNCSADGVCTTIVYTSNASAYYISIANNSWVVTRVGNFSEARDNIAFTNESNLFSEVNNFTQGIIINGNVEITPNSSNGLWTDILHIHGENMEANNNLIFAVESNGSTGIHMPHFWIQGGGPDQASGISRSFMIVNEVVALQNTTNITSCTAVQDLLGVPEEFRLDCNTTTTGADLLVSDDLLVAGDVLIQDAENEYHSLNQVVQRLDEQFNNILFNRITAVINGTNLNITDIGADQLGVLLNGTATLLPTLSQEVTLNNGTLTNPTFNYVSYQNQDNPTLTITSSEPSVDHADVAQLYIGLDTTQIYYFDETTSHGFQVIDHIYDRFDDQGALYKSGLDIGANTTRINFSTGEVRIRIAVFPYANNVSSADDFYYINGSGGFINSTSLEVLSQYSDGEDIGSNKYFNVVWGVVPINQSGMRLMAVVQDNIGTEYTNKLEAEADDLGATNFFPGNMNIRPAFVPVARTILQNSAANTFQTFKNGLLFQDVRGEATAGGGSASAPGISDHDDLNNLEWNLALHTFSATGETMDIGSYNFTTTGNVTANNFCNPSGICFTLTTLSTTVGNCSADDSCTNITYVSNATAYYISIANTSWITDNQNPVLFDLTNDYITNTTTSGINTTNIILSGNININGRVGINTSDPQELFHINSSGTPTIEIETFTAGGSDAARLKLTTPAGSWFLDADDGAQNFRFAPTVGNDFLFLSAGSNEIEIMADTSGSDGGKVGIGDRGPDAILEVSGSTVSTNIFMLSTSDNADGDIVDITNTTISFNKNTTIQANLTVTQNMTLSRLVSCDTIDTDANGILSCGTDASGSGNSNNHSIFYNKTRISLNGSFSAGGLTGYEAGNYMCNANYSGTHLCDWNEIKRTYDLKNVSEVMNWTGTAWVAGGPSKFTPADFFVNDCGGFTDSSGVTTKGNAWSFSSDKGLTGECNSLIPIACCKAW